MSFRRQSRGDSLDLLLDTMCNTFGGIIMLAVLVTLLSKQERSGRATVDSEEMMRRRISEGELTLKESRAANANLVTDAGDSDTKKRLEAVAEKKALRSMLEASARDAEAANASQPLAARDAAARMAQLREEMTKAIATRTDLSNQLSTAEINTRRLTARASDLAKQAAALQSASVQKLRLPKEHFTGKSVVNVIIQYGKVYPVHTTSRARNTAHVEFTKNGNGVTVRPLPEAGLDVRSNDWKNWLNRLAANREYIGFYVFEDSFGAFNAAKKATVDAGFDYGWEPEQLASGPLSFGAVGSQPKAQ